MLDTNVYEIMGTVLDELFTDDRTTDVKHGEIESSSLPSQWQCIAANSTGIPTTILHTKTLGGDNVNETPSSESVLGEVQAKHTEPKKQYHNLIEKRRKDSINQAIQELDSHLPRRGERHYDTFQMIRRNKTSILRATVGYISKLKADISLLEEKNGVLEAV